jgi:transcriptional regulator with XRE-family HTH domain
MITRKTTPKKRRISPSPPIAAADSPTATQSVFVAHHGQDNFGRRLRQLLDQKGMNYSDLARAVWGKTTVKGGYEVAKNRDRISVYVAGKAFPDPRNLKKIADTLGVSIADLAPERVGDAMLEQQNPTYSFTKVQDGSDMVFLRVNKLVPEAKAVKIIALLVDSEPGHDHEPDHYDLSKPPRITRLGTTP